MKISFDLDEKTYKKLKDESDKDFRSVSEMLRVILIQRYDKR